jgi:hypothetical protein
MQMKFGEREREEKKRQRRGESRGEAQAQVKATVTANLMKGKGRVGGHSNKGIKVKDPSQRRWVATKFSKKEDICKIPTQTSGDEVSEDEARLQMIKSGTVSI